MSELRKTPNAEAQEPASVPEPAQSAKQSTEKNSQGLLRLAHQAILTAAKWNESPYEGYPSDVASAIYGLTSAVYLLAAEMAKANEGEELNV